MRVGRIISAVVFDWAGTTIDYGSCAPAAVFQEIFSRRGIRVTEAQARLPMGAAKRDHIAAIAAMHAVQTQWKDRYGGPPVVADIDALYAEFLPLQREILAQHVELIPGTLETFQWLRANEVPIGSTTGYTRSLMEVVIPAADVQGFRPDSIICSDDVRVSRPAPWMMYEALHRVNAYPVWTSVKVDDTPVGIMEGRNAGAWTVAVAKTGNQLGLSRRQLEALAPDQLESRLEAIRTEFTELGADYVIDGVDQLPEVLEEIAASISEGQLPPSM